MTAGEFAFLSFGLVLGVVTGAALVEIVRSRPPAPREIRLTVTPNSIPSRRAATLAEDAFVLPGPSPASGGPADRRLSDRGTASPTDRRTIVRSPLPPAGAGDPASGLPLSRIVATRPALGFAEPQGTAPMASARGAPVGSQPGPARRSPSVAVPIHLEPDPQVQAMRAFAARTAERATIEQGLTAEAVLERAARHAGAAVAEPPTAVAAGGAGADRAAALRPVAAIDLAPTNGNGSAPRAAVGDRPTPVAHDQATHPGDGATGAGAAAGAGTAQPADPSSTTDGCAEARRVAEERCAVAALAREEAEAAQEAVRNAQRAYDEHMARAGEASAAADPREIRAAKDRAQDAFRDARSSAADHREVEAAARHWLQEINRINRAGRGGAAELLHEREAAQGLVTTIERLTVEADAARIAADAAEAACAASREAVAECEEAIASRSPSATWPTIPLIGTGAGMGGAADDETELETAFTATGAGEPAILRLLRGDRETLVRLVSELAGDDPSERRRWQLALAGLVDAVVARAIESSFLTFPTGHEFWDLFTPEQDRDIASALSSLGYRFDGLGGWADDRIPGMRDLSLAIGYAGLDPMRIRRWPREAEMAQLFRDVTVAADEYLASEAGGLTLGELVSVLGRRADGLADLWNEWGRVRPLLLNGG